MFGATACACPAKPVIYECIVAANHVFACAALQIDGEWRFDSRAGTLIWSIDLIDDTNRSGAMEFVVPATDAEHFYPIELSFSSNKTFCDIAVAGVEHTQKSAPVKYSYNKSMSTAEYQVV